MRAGAEAAEAGRSDAVIRQLHVAMIIDQNVASLKKARAGKRRAGWHTGSCRELYLDVAVDVAVAMEVAQRLQHGVDDGRDDRLLQTLQRNGKTTAVHAQLTQRGG